jgi:histidinol dehydrogenase
MLIVKNGTKDFQQRLEKIAKRGELTWAKGTEKTVKEIIHNVKTKGDDALIEYTRTFDKCHLSKQDLEVNKREITQAYQVIDNKALDALQLASQRIRAFHLQQRGQISSWTQPEEQGIWAGQIIRPLKTVGVYAPGGKAAYPSSILMNIIPAKVADVEEVILCTPPSKDSQNHINPHVLVAADLARADRIFKVGGAQAIAAMAFGTEIIPKVDKIIGPGNIYVSTAKKLVFGEAGIDMIAGPSEIVILADKTADPELVAADLLAQAEHDEQALAVLMTDTEDLAHRVAKTIEAEMATLGRQSIIYQSLQQWGSIFLTDNLDQALTLANQVGPEHLLLMVKEPWAMLAGVKNAGAVFLGNYSPVALGDYIAGPNHVLPTGNTARFFSPLGVYDFIKRTNFLYASDQGSGKLIKEAAVLARLEGLDAHAHSLELRNRGKINR